MSTVAADFQSLYKVTRSQTTSSRAGIDNANAVGKHYCVINPYVSISLTRPHTTAIVIQPFVVELIPGEGGYTAISNISNAFELGATVGQALRNYLEFLVDELFWLQKNMEQLSPSIRGDLRLLQDYLQIV